MSRRGAPSWEDGRVTTSTWESSACSWLLVPISSRGIVRAGINSHAIEDEYEADGEDESEADESPADPSAPPEIGIAPSEVVVLDVPGCRLRTLYHTFRQNSVSSVNARVALKAEDQKQGPNVSFRAFRFALE